MQGIRKILITLLLYFIITGLYAQDGAEASLLGGTYLLQKESDLYLQFSEKTANLINANREREPVPFMRLSFTGGDACLCSFIFGTRIVSMHAAFSFAERMLDLSVFKGTISLRIPGRSPLVIWIEEIGIDTYGFTILEKYGYSLSESVWKEIPNLIVYQGIMKKEGKD
ncbi:MAG: hypothetical protein JW969_02075 [Spirochaetales bacterium]|nr:hypothetical protein [Spirochaetales bacterium]